MKKEKNLQMPEINKRIDFLISDLAGGNVAEFVRMTKISSHQVLNRIFNTDNRSGKYPTPSTDVLGAIKSNLPNVNCDWLMTGKGEPYLDGNNKVGFPAQLELDFSAIIKANADMAIACRDSASAAMDAARTARIMAEENKTALAQISDSISRIEKKMDVKGAAEDAKGVVKTGGQE